MIKDKIKNFLQNMKINSIIFIKEFFTGIILYYACVISLFLVAYTFKYIGIAFMYIYDISTFNIYAIILGCMIYALFKIYTPIKIKAYFI